jgi:hypothetical protein
MEKFCQSCGMPLNEHNQSTNKDLTKSNIYCNLCYEKGEFIEPDITMDEMINREKKELITWKQVRLKKECY